MNKGANGCVTDLTVVTILGSIVNPPTLKDKFQHDQEYTVVSKQGDMQEPLFSMRNTDPIMECFQNGVSKDQYRDCDLACGQPTGAYVEMDCCKNKHICYKCVVRWFSKKLQCPFCCQQPSCKLVSSKPIATMDNTHEAFAALIREEVLSNKTKPLALVFETAECMETTMSGVVGAPHALVLLRENIKYWDLSDYTVMLFEPFSGSARLYSPLF